MCDHDYAKHDVDQDFLKAVKNGCSDCVTVLITAEADVNVRSRNNKSALMIASYFGHVNCVNALIEAGADVNFETGKNNAFWYACQKNHERCAESFLRAGIVVAQENSIEGKAILLAAKCGLIICLENLIQAGADVKIIAEYCGENIGKTPLAYAAENGFV